MIRKLKSALKRRAGFSLVEMLMAMLILMMAASIVVGGIPIAQMVLKKIVDTANAQVLMTTTMIRLRDEIGTAVGLSSDGWEITYSNSYGINTKIMLSANSSDEDRRIFIWENFDAPAGSSDKHPLVSNAAANQNLYVDYRETSYNSSDGVFTFHDLAVRRQKDSSDVLASSDKFNIWVLSASQP